MQGRTLLTATGQRPAERSRYVFAARDRMDETYDRIRSARDERWHYLRNYHPELPYSQIIRYPESHPIMQQMRQMHAAGTLAGPPALFFTPTKPPEELYDTAADPDEIRNLADSSDPQHQAKLHELRQAMDAWQASVGDLGAVPEAELVRRGLVTENGSAKPSGANEHGEK
jgi:N-sulfoglucosamine sulfohydrolase